MKLNCYFVYDELHEQILFPACAPNDSIVIRENSRALYSLNRDFAKEFSLHKFGFFDTRDLDGNGYPKFVPCDCVSVSWDSYEGFHEIVESMTSHETKALQLQRNGKTAL